MRASAPLSSTTTPKAPRNSVEALLLVQITARSGNSRIFRRHLLRPAADSETDEWGSVSAVLPSLQADTASKLDRFFFANAAR
jgi:hypothetical protein